MNGTVAVENNTKVQALFEEIMGIDVKRKHITIRNKYAIGIVRKYQEIFIYDYDLSSRPLVKVKKAGQTVLLRLGFKIEETLDILENLLRIMQAMTAPKEEAVVQPPKGELPVHYPKVLQDTNPRNSVGLSQSGKIVMHNNVQFKTRTEA